MKLFKGPRKNYSIKYLKEIEMEMNSGIKSEINGQINVDSLR